MSEPVSLLPAEAGHPVLRTGVAPEWLDHNGHMNVAAYLIAFDRACCAFSREAGIGPENIGSSGHTIFVGQANVLYRREVNALDELIVAARVRDLVADRMHLALSMYRLQPAAEPELAAMCEESCVCVAMATRRPAHFPPKVAAFFERFVANERNLPAPRIAIGPVNLTPRTRSKEPLA